MRFFDAHNHLQDDCLDPWRESIVRVCTDLPVASMVVNGMTEADWPEVASLAQRFPFARPSFGLHPWYLHSRSRAWEAHLREALRQHPTAGVGEFGLDRWIPNHDLADQIDVFRIHLAIAGELGRAASIHCLRAWDELLPLLEETVLPWRGFLVHAYGGPPDLVPRLVDLGAYFSFSGYFLSPGQERKLPAFRLMPPGRLLVETDAPAMPLPASQAEFVLPRRKDGPVLNHPGNIRAVYLGLAQVRAMDPEALSDQVEANFRRLFAGSPGLG